MSAETGLAPDVLADHDADMLMTLADEVGRRRQREHWRQGEEFLAELVELLSIIRREALALGGVKGHHLPEPIRIERPGEPKDNGVHVMTPRQYARHMARGG